ncbi:MAG: hypothetical protein ABSB19_08060 [Methylomonas sp.]|jgi:hypothetical protein
MVSPASSGPAGSIFEGQVAATYLLSMLIGSEPRGLPGTIIDQVKLQRAEDGYPLDDVIICAHDEFGEPATLEIQVKRSISFAPHDRVFKKIVEQIAKVSIKPEFWIQRYELAIATAQTSRQIDHSYLEVLNWARNVGDAATFFARINRKLLRPPLFNPQHQF